MSRTVTVYLLRHGQTAMNADNNRYCGITDVELTTVGEQQAVDVGQRLQELSLDALFSSPLKRARRTAELLGLDKEVQVDPRLIELDFGQWEGKTREEFIAENPDSWANWNTDPEAHPAGGDGETAKSVINRLNSFYEEVLSKYSGGTIAVVGHNGLNRILLAKKLGMPIRNYRSIVQENSCLTVFTLTDEDFQLLKLNCK